MTTGPDTRDYTPADPSSNPVELPGQPPSLVLIPALADYLSADYAVPAAGVIVGEIYANYAGGTAALFTWDGGAHFIQPIDLLAVSTANMPFRFVTMVKAGDLFNLHFNADSTPFRTVLQFVQSVPQWL